MGSERGGLTEIGTKWHDSDRVVMWFETERQIIIIKGVERPFGFRQLYRCCPEGEIEMVLAHLEDE